MLAARRQSPRRGCRSVCPESGDELAGESLASVVTKQRCSWWPAVGETRPSRSVTTKSLWGASKQPVRSIKRTFQLVVNLPLLARGKSGSRARTTGAKAMDGVKTLDVQHPGTRRRMEGGTVVQLITEQEESVSAPALWPQVADLRCSVAAKPTRGDP